MESLISLTIIAFFLFNAVVTGLAYLLLHFLERWFRSSHSSSILFSHLPHQTKTGQRPHCDHKVDFDTGEDDSHLIDCSSCERTLTTRSVDVFVFLWNLLVTLKCYGGALFCFTYFIHTDQTSYVVLLPGMICLVGCGFFAAMLGFNSGLLYGRMTLVEGKIGVDI